LFSEFYIIFATFEIDLYLYVTAKYRFNDEKKTNAAKANSSCSYNQDNNAQEYKTFLLKRQQHLAGGGRWIGDSASRIQVRPILITHLIFYIEVY